jgi:hypothetical protein
MKPDEGQNTTVEIGGAGEVGHGSIDVVDSAFYLVRVQEASPIRAACVWATRR